jgi:hypothetical protein
VSETPSRPAVSPFAGGGIAAAAAQAAALRANKQAAMQPAYSDDEVVSEIPSPFAGGGIATASALLANEQTALQQTESEDEVINELQSRPGISPFAAGGGIAGFVAQGAILQSTNIDGKLEKTKDVTIRDETSEYAKSPFQRGCIAATNSSSDINGYSFTNVDLSEQEKKFDFDHYSGVLAFQLSGFATNNGLNFLYERTLLTSLNTANQAMSVGMTGWLEYGSSTILDRSMDRTFEIMERLAHYYAVNGKLDISVDVLRSLLVKCEFNLPLHHPITLVVLLDLSGALLVSSQDEQARRLVWQASHRLSKYLGEQETMYCNAIDEWSNLPPEDKLIFRRRTADDFLSMLRAFVSFLEELLGREFPGVLGPTSETVLLNHCLLGDSMAVLANCLSMKELDHLVIQRESTSVWTCAMKHYRAAFEGWAKVGRSLSHPNTVSAACGLCRCLRELGKLEQAINILSMVVSATKSQPTKAGLSRDLGNLPSITFLPPASGSPSTCLQARLSSGREQSSALCLWYLAAYSIEAHPNENGRIHALNLLHASSECLRRALKANTDGSYANTLLEMLRCVEDEARELFKPIKAANDENPREMSNESGIDEDASIIQIGKKVVESARQAFRGHFVSA